MKTVIDFTIVHAKIETSNNYTGFRFWTIFCDRADGRHSRYVLTLNIMQNLGIAKTLNSTNKVNEWLNSSDGLKWLNKRKFHSVGTSFGEML